ncbi:MAG: glycoside hydrolase family 36 protein [Planctomycetota bacterium]
MAIGQEPPQECLTLRRWADADLLGETPPFSFAYDGKPSATLLSAWKRTHTKQPAAEGKEKHSVVYTDPATGLEVACEMTFFVDFPAVEWVLNLRNRGAADSPLLENIHVMDLRLAASLKAEVMLHHAHGSTCTATDFLPIAQPVKPKSEIRLAPNGGRSSNGQLPFFNLEWDGGGLVGAIGWSGQWAMIVHRDNDVRLLAGQQTTRLRLHPGECIRTPRILLVMWRGSDRMRGHNLFRQVMLAHYAPRIDGELVLPPVTENTWFAFNTGNAVTEENQMEAMRPMAKVGVEAFWLDAGWFEGGWPSGVGSWTPKPEAFPRGLKPLGDAAREKGMGFVLWFEPERVNPQSRIAREHPQWVLRAGEGDGLFNLGDPDARKWLTDYLSTCISEWGITIYRQDFNIDPLRFWQAADAPERQGMTEIRYVEGLYGMWDDLLRRHPKLAIDNCASGGRRVDLETCHRSFPLWRSDTQCCQRPMPVQDQVQTAGLSLYVPLHAAGVWDFDPYVFRSVATTGVNLCMDLRGKEASLEKARRAIEETKSLRPFWIGDCYPLFEINLDESHWCGWQFHRPDLAQGFAMVFRRSQSPYSKARICLRGLVAEEKYIVTFVDRDKKTTLTGADLQTLSLELESPATSVLILYEKATQHGHTR